MDAIDALLVGVLLLLVRLSLSGSDNETSARTEAVIPKETEPSAEPRFYDLPDYDLSLYDLPDYRAMDYAYRPEPASQPPPPEPEPEPAPTPRKPSKTEKDILTYDEWIAYLYTRYPTHHFREIQ